MVLFRLSSLLATAAYLSVHASFLPAPRAVTPVWETLPPTPTLPGNPVGTRTPINGVQIWHAEFGTKATSKLPVIMLHGGMANSRWWGAQVEQLMKKHYVIVMDTRGQGRSTMDDTPFSYDLFAQDAAALLKTLGVSKAAWIGWSDGGDSILSALLDPKIAPMVARGFTTGANHSPDALNVTYGDTQMATLAYSRVAAEFDELQPNGNITALVDALNTLGSTQPMWTKADLQKITLGSKLTLSWGDHEEAINLSEAAFMHDAIPKSKLVLAQNVSHFGLVQDPKQFTTILENFLA
ncbi:Alpha/Beta hydrolase protein [Rhizoctonia solani]|nr:Alpha/Beta hydrolase protein [Rhizoctonia solani]